MPSASQTSTPARKALAVTLSIILMANVTLLMLRKIEPLQFWLVLGAGAACAYVFKKKQGN